MDLIKLLLVIILDSNLVNHLKQNQEHLILFSDFTCGFMVPITESNQAATSPDNEEIQA